MRKQAGRLRDPSGWGADVPASVRLDSIRRTFGKGNSAVEALRGVSVSFERGSFTAVMGPSGSGKSTFLHCAAGLDLPTSGTVILDGIDLAGMNDTALSKLRRDRIGFIFQGFNLMPALTVGQNITLPLRLAGRRVDRSRLVDVISRVGLSDRLDHLPGELSGGQQQRVAIGRALITDPAVVFADEPTGALDSVMAGEVLDLLRESVVVNEQTVVMVTHDPVAAAYADRVVFLADGQIVGSMESPTAEAVAENVTHLDSRSRRRRMPILPSENV
jgi:putative ABC transport system ATP-binding protein